MNHDIVRLGEKDFDEAMDFLGLAFSVHGYHDFSTLLPKLYRPLKELMECNYVIREKERIVALVGLFPMQWQVGETHLKVGGIGGVATHARVRGKGYMQALMQHCVRLMRQEGYALSYLGGQRQRYGYFGYEKCGWAPSYTIGQNNLRHIFKEHSAVRFAPFLAEDYAYLEQAHQMYQQKDIRMVRPLTEFHRVLLSWNSQPYVAFDTTDEMVGYLVADKNGTTISELVGIDTDWEFEMVRAWAQGQQETLEVKTDPLRYGLGQKLGYYCENSAINGSGSWQVFNWVEVVDSLLKAKHRTQSLIAAKVLIDIQGYGNLCLEVSGNDARCTLSKASADLRCTPLMAHRLLFGPLPATFITELSAQTAALQAWGPLPLYWARQDGV